MFCCRDYHCRSRTLQNSLKNYFNASYRVLPIEGTKHPDVTEKIPYHMNRINCIPFTDTIKLPSPEVQISCRVHNDGLMDQTKTNDMSERI